MSARFEILSRPAAPIRGAPARFRVHRSTRCISCGECIAACIYGVHERRPDDARHLSEPLSARCRACLVCPQQCPRRALEVEREPELDGLGTSPYDAQTILTCWQESDDGKIPVRGAGYAGPFRGQGFDGIWTDMSEIVRPTRDGIHGRETISTQFDLGRKLPDLSGASFDSEGRLLDRIPLTREIPVPLLFGRPPFGAQSIRLLGATVRAAMELKTFVVVDLGWLRACRVPADPDPDELRAVRYVRENRNHLVLRIDHESFPLDGNGPRAEGEARSPARSTDPEPLLTVGDVTRWASVVELVDNAEVLDQLRELRARNSELVVLVELPAMPDAAARAVEIARGGADGIHLACGWRGQWANGDGDCHVVTQAIRETHLALVEASVRDEISLLVSGGIARAEHVPKAVLVGADAVIVDVPPLVAMGCRVCGECPPKAGCPAKLDSLEPHGGASRVVNLIAAWRNQLLEILGAMGLREVRRLRGEVGRGLFADKLEPALLGSLAPLDGGEPPLALSAYEPAMLPVPELMRNRYGLWRVARTADCQLCGACANHCSRGVLDWPAGLRRPPPPIEEQCTGLDCAEGCQASCPNGALRIWRDNRLGVVEHTRWTHALIVESWQRAEGLGPRAAGEITSRGTSGGGFDQLELVVPPSAPQIDPARVDLSLELNRRSSGPQVQLPLPIYGGGMSYGSVSLSVMVGRARAAAEIGTFTSTGEGGYPDELVPYANHVITQIATGYFGVSEQSIARARLVELKYAQGAKPGLGGHLLGDKNTPLVAKLREAVAGTALFSPFPFHSVYSIEDHRKHVDWVRQINPNALVSVKVSTPGDVDMVAVGSYHAGANIVHLDGAYGGTGAAPEVAKKNIAMPIELALRKTHDFLVAEGIRDEVVLMASGGIRTPLDIAKAIALGADGVVVGTAELVAISCLLCRNCEKDRGCPRGIATTDPDLERHLNADWVARRIVNLYRCWERELRTLLAALGLQSSRALRGRCDLLRFRPRTADPTPSSCRHG